MIHDILSSDVDFAKGMMNASHSDAEILVYLASRGLEPANAAHLVDDLRHGRKPSVRLPSEFRPAGHSAVGGRGLANKEAAPAQHSHPSRSGSRKHRRSDIPWWFIILAGIALLAFGYVFFGSGTRVSRDAVDLEKHQIPPPPGK